VEFKQTPLAGAWLITLDPRVDERGSFTRSFDANGFAERGLCTEFVQHNLSETAHAGTLRGMHFQRPPHAEVKLVQCTRGAIFDVIIDLRRGSPTFRQWFGVELNAENKRSLYVPEGFAHGFLTLTDDVQVYYLHSTEYAPEFQDGVRYDDPGIGIAWPAPAKLVSEKDATLANFDAGHAIIPLRSSGTERKFRQ
jgi:dTDP-4-dehydrorhamnose 3,5-epimerase